MKQKLYSDIPLNDMGDFDFREVPMIHRGYGSLPIINVIYHPKDILEATIGIVYGAIAFQEMVDKINTPGWKFWR